MRCYLTSRWRIQKAEETGARQLEAAVTSLDQGGDRDALLQQHDTAFCLPFRFHYHPHEGDQVPSPEPGSFLSPYAEARTSTCGTGWLVTSDPWGVSPTQESRKSHLRWSVVDQC